MTILTKYVSVTNGDDGSGDGSSGNPYFSIEKARDDINGTSNVGPHYIILSESSATTTTYSASYGMPSDSEQELWIGNYNYGVIVSGAAGQDIIIDGKGVTNKNAFVLYGSGSGVHNLTITGYGTHSTAGRGVIRASYRPCDIRGINISGNLQGGITFFGDRYSQGGISIIDSCRVELPAQNNIWGISAYSNFAIGHVIVNNCLVVISGSTSATPTHAIYIYNGNTSQSTASFNTVVGKFDETVHTDSAFGITADRAENNIISMSLPDDTSRVSFISADVATNNLYAGFNSANVTTVGARRQSNDTSASFHSTELSYKRDQALTLFNEPDSLFRSVYADWTLDSGAPALNAGTALSYFDLTATDLSGTTRADPPEIGAFEFVAAVTGYGHTVNGVVAGSLGEVLGVTKANISKVIGT